MSTNYDYLQFGSGPKNARKYWLDRKKNKARKKENGTHPCRPMEQQLLDQVWELLTSGKQPQVVGMEDGGLMLWVDVEMVQEHGGCEGWNREREI